MGSRDYRHHEPKKSKKDAKKLPPVNVLPTTVEVEVIRKGKKQRELEPEGKEVEEE